MGKEKKEGTEKQKKVALEKKKQKKQKKQKQKKSRRRRRSRRRSSRRRRSRSRSRSRRRRRRRRTKIKEESQKSGAWLAENDICNPPSFRQLQTCYGCARLHMETLHHTSPSRHSSQRLGSQTTKALHPIQIKNFLKSFAQTDEKEKERKTRRRKKK